MNRKVIIGAAVAAVLVVLVVKLHKRTAVQRAGAKAKADAAEPVAEERPHIDSDAAEVVLKPE